MFRVVTSFCSKGGAIRVLRALIMGPGTVPIQGFDPLDPLGAESVVP